MSRTLDELVQRFEGQTIAVVGDIMLDHFVVGRVDRLSPEAPVPVVTFDHDEFRLGGAANVAHNLAALGADARLVGLIGTDDAAQQIRRGLSDAGLRTEGLVTDPDRPTTRKVRVVTSRNQQVARVDYESTTDIAAAVLERLAAQVCASAASARRHHPVGLSKRGGVDGGDRRGAANGRADRRAAAGRPEGFAAGLVPRRIADYAEPP